MRGMIGRMGKLLALSACLIASAAQAIQREDAQSGHLVSLADSLRARGIGLTPGSLTAALRNSDPEIRSLAALKLAEDRDSGAIPEIETALSVEHNTKARINLSSALASLNDPKGLSYLEAMCSDEGLPIRDVADVIRELSLFERRSPACADSVMRYIDAHKDSESRLAVIPILAAVYPWTEGDKAQHIVKVLERSLEDDDPAVRLQAGHTLAQIQSRSSESALRQAIGRERDPAVRSGLARDLDSLIREP